MTTTPDELFGGGFAEVRDGTTVPTVIRPARDALTAAAQDDETPSEEAAHTGVVVVALPAASEPVHDIGPEDPKHATLLYLGDLPGAGDNPNALLTDDARALLEQVCATVAAEFPVRLASALEVAPLGDGGAHVWMLDEGLDSLRAALLTDEVEPLVDAVEQFPSFTAHVTIGYEAGNGTGDPDNPADLDEPDDAFDLTDDNLDEARQVDTITFDRVALWWAGDQTEWALTGGQEEDTVSTTTEEGLTASVRARIKQSAADLVTLGVMPSVEEARAYLTRAAVTAAAGDPAPALQTLDAGEPAPALVGEQELDDQFHGVMIVENSQTGDRRVFAPGAIRLDAPLPMPIGWQVQDAPGHDGSVVCGRFDTLTRIGNLITFTGTWDLEGPGWETRRLVQGGFLTGLSADTDDCEVQIVTEDGAPLGGFDFMFSEEEPLLMVMDSRIRSAAMCRVPAFTEAFIANGTPPDGWAGERPGAPAAVEEPTDLTTPAMGEAAVELVAAAVRADNPPVLPPVDARFFANPQLTEPTPLTVDPDGRVFGHIATWGTCHIGIDGYCQEPPASASNYAYFATGALPTADGSRVHVGALTMGTGHARPGATLREAVEHYDNTGSAVADIATGQDGLGIWFSGRIRPGTTPEQVHALAAAGSVSGDWREAVRFSGELELVAALVVNVPGFPIARPALAASGNRVYSLVAAGALTPDVQTRGYSLQEAAALAADLMEDRLARRDRVAAASGKINRALRSQTLARIDRALRGADRSL